MHDRASRGLPARAGRRLLAPFIRFDDSYEFDWRVILFVTLSPIAAVVGSAWWAASGRYHGETMVLALVLAILTGLGVTAGYHRLYAHRSYDAVWPVRLFFLLCGATGMEDSALKWSWDHRRHHRFIDQANDPYDISRGFWHAHFFWMFRKRDLAPGETWPADLWKDRLVRLQHRYYLPVASLLSLGLPTGLAALWGDPWGGLFVAGFARIVINHHFTFAINSVCHRYGTRHYSDRHSARDNPVTAFFTYGEGYHNFHHEFASDYRNGPAPYHFDPSKWLIWTLAKARLAQNLRRTRPDIIRAKRAEMRLKQQRLSTGAV